MIQYDYNEKNVMNRAVLACEGVLPRYSEHVQYTNETAPHNAVMLNECYASRKPPATPSLT